MEFERHEMVPASGFREPQKMEVAFITTFGDEEFIVQMEGDVIIDDGEMDHGVFALGLNVEEALNLHGELHTWLMTQGVHFSQILLGGRENWIPSPEELEGDK